MTLQLSVNQSFNHLIPEAFDLNTAKNSGSKHNETMANSAVFQTHFMSPQDLDLPIRHMHNPTEMAIQAMAASLKQRGQLSPIIAGERFILADGFKRQSAAQSINLTFIAVMTLKNICLHAKTLMYLISRTQNFTMLQESILIREFMEVDGLQQVEVALMLDRHKSWISRRLDMIRPVTKSITNLARCFCCQKNFNTIDLLMSVGGSEFRESVLFFTGSAWKNIKSE